MKNKGLQTFFYSTLGVVVMALILIAFNIITSAFKVRADLTEEKAYTLSPGTKTILSELKSPVKIRFYCTQPETASRETVALRSYAREVEDLLNEFKIAAKGKITIEKYNPQPDSDAEDSARLDGIQGQMLSNGERFYMGLTVSRLDEKQEIPFLSPARERQLEYDVARAISLVANPIRPVIGIMSPLPIWGQQANPMMQRMGQSGSDPWIIVNELKRDFDVRKVEMTDDKIDDDIKLLVVIHPKDITDEAQFAIDQFIMRGGQLIAFLDPYAVMDAQKQNQMMGMGQGSSSSLDKLLPAWGLSFDKSKVVADRNLAMKLAGRDGQPFEQPTWLSLTSAQMNDKDITTADIDNVWLPMVGAFTGTPADGLKEVVLLKSTKDSEMVEGFMAALSGDSILKDFKSDDKERTLALRLEGKFKTAFPDGKPGETKDDSSTNAAPAKTEWLKESTGDSAVILVGDADLIYDHFAVDIMNSIFGRIARPLNANLNFAQNCVEQMAGDKNLIQVRSRATLNRPFEVVKDMEAEAQRKYQGEISDLEKKAQETQKRLSELQGQKTDANQRFILSPEQEKEVANLRKQEAEAQKNLREVKKSLKREIVGMQTRIKWINILTMPLLISLTGIVLAVVKSRKTGAR